MARAGRVDEGPRPLVLRVCLAVDRGRYLEPTLDQALARSRLVGPDRGLATQLAYGVFQRLLYLDHALARWLPNPSGLPPAVRWILRLGSYEKLFLRTPDHAAVYQWVEIAKSRAPGHAGLVNAVLRRVTPRPASPWIEASIPQFLFQHWAGFFGDVGFVKAFNQPPPLWVTAFPGAEEALRAEGVAFRPGPVPGSLAIAGGPLRALTAYRRGLIQPQNPASLLAAQLLSPRPGDRILDLAGGAGIKAAWLAAQGAEVVSVDRDRRRQEEGRKNLARLGLRVHFVTADLTRGVTERAPKVLLDAPCTGTGTIRHHPELRYRLHPNDPKRMRIRQTTLLEAAAQAVAPGGLLVYAVCSLTEDEGEGVIHAFLAGHPDFAPDPIATDLPVLKRGLGVYLRPEAGLDGFYYALLRRR